MKAFKISVVAVLSSTVSELSNERCVYTVCTMKTSFNDAVVHHFLVKKTVGVAFNVTSLDSFPTWNLK